MGRAMNTTRAAHPRGTTHHSASEAGAYRGAPLESGGVQLAVSFAEALAMACLPPFVNTRLGARPTMSTASSAVDSRSPGGVS